MPLPYPSCEIELGHPSADVGVQRNPSCGSSQEETVEEDMMTKRVRRREVSSDLHFIKGIKVNYTFCLLFIYCSLLDCMVIHL